MCGSRQELLDSTSSVRQSIASHRQALSSTWQCSETGRVEHAPPLSKVIFVERKITLLGGGLSLREQHHAVPDVLRTSGSCAAAEPMLTCRLLSSRAKRSHQSRARS